MTVIIPEAHLAHVADAHRRLFAAVDGLTDAQARAPSPLPGWTVGHVLTHLARNADSHVRRAEAATRGEVIDQYVGGLAGRGADIEAGAGRGAAELVADVRRSGLAAEAAWWELPVEAWSRITRDGDSRERPLFELPSRRWQEVEVHLVDLGVGPTPRDWPDAFVIEWLPRTRERMDTALAPESRSLRWESPADELAWFYGRLHRDDAPDPPAWG
ncbi:MAG: maleylpyruvate isomerase N-terminal domain-containing protein [Acidimicrobiales bacterium]